MTVIMYDNSGDHNLHFSQKDIEAQSSMTRLRSGLGAFKIPGENHSRRLPSCSPRLRAFWKAAGAGHSRTGTTEGLGAGGV